MKTARLGCMALGIALLMFMIAPLASAQPFITGEWFKGTISFKGYEVSDINSDVSGTSNGKGNIYVNIVQGTDVFTVTTCIEDRDVKKTWNLGIPNTIPKSDIFTDSKYQIWDFSNDSVMQFYGPAYAYPVFKVTFNKPFPDATTASFKSFACTAYDDTSYPPNYSVGSCSISFKNLDAAKVPRGATGCIP
jgi:hypothetical protein